MFGEKAELLHGLCGMSGVCLYAHIFQLSDNRWLENGPPNRLQQKRNKTLTDPSKNAGGNIPKGF